MHKCMPKYHLFKNDVKIHWILWKIHIGSKPKATQESHTESHFLLYIRTLGLLKKGCCNVIGKIYSIPVQSRIQSKSIPGNSTSPLFGDFMCGLWLVLKDRKNLLIGESDVITLYCQPSQRLHELFLYFNTNQKPHIKSINSRDFKNKKYLGLSPDPFSSCPNIKEEKAVWLRETT